MPKHNFPFSLSDICELEGFSVFTGRASVETHCPNCGKKTLSLNFQNDVFNCFNPGCGIHGGVLQFYLCLENKELPLSQARAEIMERLYGITSCEQSEDAKKEAAERMRKRKEQMEKEIVKESNLRSIEFRDKTYSALLGMLTLAKDHENDLLKRGLSRATIEKRKYRTTPIASYEEYPLRLLEEGLYVDGIPGMYKNDNNKWTIRKVKRGIMIPIMSRHNQIEGFQIRKDDKLLKKWYKRNMDGSYCLDNNHMKILEKENKFTWLSSKGLNEGVGPNGAIHYACEFEEYNGVCVPRLADNSIVLTEGPLKGDILLEQKSYPAICVPGVSCQYFLGKELDYLITLGLKTVYVAYDMDFEKNEAVYKQLHNCYKLILSKKLKVMRMLWNSDKKGIDDYVAWKGNE